MINFHKFATFLLVGAFAEPESDAKPHADSKADADALAWYASYGYWPIGYTGYYYTHGYPLAYSLYGRKKRAADAVATPDAEPVSKADADALIYYTTYGVLPVGYTGYYYTHPYLLYGRKKREADAEPHADSKADADALAWYAIHGYWPVGYTGYYYTHGYPLAYSLYGRKKRAAEAEPRPAAEPHADSKADADALAHYGLYGYWPRWYTGYYYYAGYPYYWYGK